MTASWRRPTSLPDLPAQARLAAQDAERRAVARDLHDEIGQVLTALRLSASALAERLDDPALQDLASDILALSQEALSQVRNLARGLHPPQLEQLGLVAALQDLCERHSARGPAVLVLHSVAPVPRARADVELTAYRIAQEAVTNALRHGAATRIQLHVSATDQRLCVQVDDNGSGHDTGAAPGFGRQAMRERTELLHGTLQETASPAGTRVIASLPLHLRG